jgi:hypothetical protein
MEPGRLSGGGDGPLRRVPHPAQLRLSRWTTGGNLPARSLRAGAPIISAPTRTSGLGDWTDEDLATYLSTGHADGHGGSAGPMGEATDNSLTFLTPGDIRSLVVYLRSVPARQTDLPRRGRCSSTRFVSRGRHGATRSARRDDLRQRLCLVSRLDGREPDQQIRHADGRAGRQRPIGHQRGADGHQRRDSQDRRGSDLHAGVSATAIPTPTSRRYRITSPRASAPRAGISPKKTSFPCAS